MRNKTLFPCKWVPQKIKQAMKTHEKVLCTTTTTTTTTASEGRARLNLEVAPASKGLVLKYDSMEVCPGSWQARQKLRSNLALRNPWVAPRQNQMFSLVIIIMIIHLTRNKIGHDCLLLPASQTCRETRRKFSEVLLLAKWNNFLN